ncbi:MAG: NAD-glutamate dehydrogenase [Proteobacteria bacterium]|nr:NAD-glutamate dehydrogenase [Pseudomonadota bacterium]
MESNKDILSLVGKKEGILRDMRTTLSGKVSKDKAIFEKRTFDKYVELISKRFSLDFLESLTSDQIYAFIKNRYRIFEQSLGQETKIVITDFLPDFPEVSNDAVVLDMVIKDHPFIIDSLTEFVHEKRYNLGLMYYTTVEAEKNDKNKLVTLRKGEEDAPNSITNVTCILNNFDKKNLKSLESGVYDLMEMVTCVTDDFGIITESIEEYTVKPEKGSESLIDSERRNLFAWFNSGNVILLGGGEVAKDDVSDNLTWKKIENPMGYARRKKELKDKNLPKEIGRYGRFFLESGMKINLIETDDLSEVHKKEPLQILFGRKKDKSGNVKVNFYYVLFTNKSLKEDALSIPLARLKVNSILDSYFELNTSGERTGHMIKAANDFFSIIPKRELFRLDRQELEAIYRQFLYFGDYQQTKLSVYAQPKRSYARICFCMPHHRFSPNIFDRIGCILSKHFGVDSEMNYWFNLGRNSYSHHLFFFPDKHPQLAKCDLSQIEQEVANLTVGWEDGLQNLLANLGNDKASKMQAKYADVFTPFYQAVFTPGDAVADIEFLEALLESGHDQVDLRTTPNNDNSVIYIYSLKEYNLTEIMPNLQNLDLIVTDENTYNLKVDEQQLFIYTYYVKGLKEKLKQYPSFGTDFCELLLAVLEDRTEDDVLNGLLLSAGLNIQEINLFILYRNYYWQIGAPYLPINKGFLENPEVMVALRDYFFAKFKPNKSAKKLSDKELDKWREKTFKAIYNVKTVAEDIIFKTIFNLMDATVRTNYFDIDPSAAMAIKVRSEEVEQMPVPKPLFEIYVHGTHVEGIHLRGAMIARGGLRHSDRHDDFRTEILGLMHTQMLKNVVIVPEGSKGGFVSKKILDNPQERREDALIQYKRYINSLLSLTDNIVEGKIVPAKGLIRYDSDDPYFVVAADKGTATYSDTANEISASRNFWLDDAFASGGKHGYDHKGMGITAKGAWESVKFHFLEEGVDVQTTDFTVIGIGDMSGDVFGNGMLLSKHIRLIGAFNHIHIFIDPDPDAATSWKERERLFNTPRTNWMDYDKKLISKGGGVFERSAKTIQLTPEIQKVLGTGAESVSGEDLIKLLLQARVDLLWNGGIGTYVKSSDETAHEVGDAANDAVRIDARQLRVKVVGEGGNLGLTQLARLEASVRGVKLNTDAIDNSGGVDTSDHEVNLKILMRFLMEEGQIPSADSRNQLLEDLTDDIADLVLADNRGQVQVLSMDNLRSQVDIKQFIDLTKFLAEQGVLDPRTSKMSTYEQLEDYFSRGIGIPRPDLSILLSYTKMYFYKEIIQSELLDDPYLDDVYYNYFPQAFLKQFDITKIQHPLKKEIIGTVLINNTINQAGVTILPEVFSIVDTSASNIITAYTIVDQLFQLGSLRIRIMETLKTKNLNLAYELLINLEKQLSDMIIWMLYAYKPAELRFSLAAEFESQITEYREALDKSLDQDDKASMEAAINKLTEKGIPSDLAKDIAQMDYMKSSLEIILQAKKSKIAMADAVVLSRALDSMFHFQILHDRIMTVEQDSVWVKRHRGLLMKQLQVLKQQVSNTIISRFKGKADFDDKVGKFMKNNQSQFKQFQIEYNQIINNDVVELSGIAILLDRIAQLAS